MELEKFIEKDIREFLEEKAETDEGADRPGVMRGEEVGAFEFNRDYAKEVQDALSKGHLNGARQVFLDLRKQYKNFPKESPERRKAYSIMSELKKYFERYLDSLPEGSQTPESPEEMGVKLPGERKSYEEKREEQIERLKKEKRMKDVLMKEIKKNLDRIENLLGKGDVVAAVVLYRYVKDSFRKIPKRFKDERKEIYDQVITCYYQIRKAAGDLKEVERKARKLDKQEVIENHSLEKPSEEAARPRREPAEAETEDGRASAEKDETSEEERGGRQRPEQPPSPNQEPEETPVEESEQVEEAGMKKEEMLRELEELRDLIEDKKPREGFTKYKELKKKFSELEAPKNVKEEIFKDLVSLHHSLKELEEHEVEQKQMTVDEEPVIKEEEEKGEAEELLERMKKGKMKAYRYLDNDNVEGAVIQYNELRDLFKDIPDDMEEEKDRLHREIFDLYDQIIEERKGELNNAKGDYEKGASGVWDDVERVKDLVRNDRVDEAKELFLKVQHEVVKVPDDRERKEMYKAMDNLKSKLHLADSARSWQERRVET